MRPIAFIAVIISPVLLTAQAPQQTAGDRYKSVHVLTDVPATQIIPTMAFISNSLGVTCLHCHNDANYESDEKPMKEKARGMIRMMRVINDTQFKGERIVTCQTCHNGHARPQSTPPVENAAWNQRAVAEQKPLPEIFSVLDSYERAVGVAALNQLKSQRLSGTVTRNSGRSAPVSDTFEVFQQRPSTMRLSTKLSHPPEGDVELPMAFLRPTLIRSAYTDLRVVGRDAIGDDSVIVVAGINSRKIPHRLYFSERSGLLVRRTDELETPLGFVPERYDFQNFRQVDGVQVPMTITWSRADYQVQFTATDVRHNVQ